MSTTDGAAAQEQQEQQQQRSAQVGDAMRRGHAQEVRGGKGLLSLFTDAPVAAAAAGGVIFALGYGLRNMASGNQQGAQVSMRARVALQGTAVASLLGYAFWQKHKESQARR